MRAARIHGYRQPLVLEDVKVPEIAADEVLLKVANTYAWFLDLRDGKIAKAFAFFDSVAFNEF